MYIQTCTNSRPFSNCNSETIRSKVMDLVQTVIFTPSTWTLKQHLHAFSASFSSTRFMICHDMSNPWNTKSSHWRLKEWVNSGLLGIFFILKPHLNFLNRILGISAQPIHILSFSFSVLSCSVDGPLLFTALKHKLSLSLLPVAGETNLTLATLSACLHLSRQILIGKN